MCIHTLYDETVTNTLEKFEDMLSPAPKLGFNVIRILYYVEACVHYDFAPTPASCACL